MKFIEITKPDGTTIKVSEARLAVPAVAERYGYTPEATVDTDSEPTPEATVEPAVESKDPEPAPEAAVAEPVASVPKTRARKA